MNWKFFRKCETFKPKNLLKFPWAKRFDDSSAIQKNPFRAIEGLFGCVHSSTIFKVNCAWSRPICIFNSIENQQIVSKVNRFHTQMCRFHWMKFHFNFSNNFSNRRSWKSRRPVCWLNIVPTTSWWNDFFWKSHPLQIREDSQMNSRTVMTIISCRLPLRQGKKGNWVKWAPGGGSCAASRCVWVTTTDHFLCKNP